MVQSAQRMASGGQGLKFFPSCTNICLYEQQSRHNFYITLQNMSQARTCCVYVILQLCRHSGGRSCSLLWTSPESSCDYLISVVMKSCSIITLLTPTPPLLAVYAELVRSSLFSNRNQECTQALWEVFSKCPLCEQACKTITDSQRIPYNVPGMQKNAVL